MASPGAPALSDPERAWGAFSRQTASILAAFESSLEHPQVAQERRLTELVNANADSEFGRRHDFGSIRSIDDFRRRVPISTWPDLAPWIERAKAEYAPVLTTEKPVHFERTSGSSAAVKDVPYTPSLLKEFQRALVVWLAKLHEDCPSIAGPAYWALSPAGAADQRTANGTPLGSASDAEYLAGSAAATLLPTLLDTQSAVDDPATWRLGTLAQLVATEALALVSVWSPTFLTALLAPLLDPAQQPGTLEWLRARVPARRFAQVTKAVAAHDFSPLWPELAVVSCWMDGPSKHYVEPLAACLPQARFVPKGLFATEGVVSIPWGISELQPLAIESHVLEFIDDDGVARLPHELEERARYQPVLTTGGGLYRYCLGDVVEVRGFLRRTPCVRFVGRADTRSDLAGEKLDEALAAEALRAVPGEVHSAVLVPMADARPLRYLLLLETPAPGVAETIAADVERELGKVHHYALARRAGQLAALAVKTVPSMATIVHRAWESLGRRAGDAKPAALIASLPQAREMIRMADDEAAAAQQ